MWRDCDERRFAKARRYSPAMTTTAARRLEPALLVILAGVVAALHIGKLPPAIPVLRDALGLTLVQAGFLLSLVQLAGMTTGVVFGVVADGLGSASQHDARARAAGRRQRARRPRARRGAVDAAARRRRLRLPARRAAGAGARAIAGRAAAGQRDDGRVGRLHAARDGTGAAARAAGDRGDRLARLVVDAGRAVGGDGGRGFDRRVPADAAAARDAAVVAVARAAAPDAGRAGPVAGGDVVRDVLGAVAGGDRLPAVDLRPERHRRCRRPAC